MMVHSLCVLRQHLHKCAVPVTAHPMSNACYDIALNGFMVFFISCPGGNSSYTVYLHFCEVPESLGIFHLYSVSISIVFEHCSWEKTFGCQLCGLTGTASLLYTAGGRMSKIG